MNASKKMMVLLVGLLVFFVACKKDEENGGELISKIGLPVSPAQEIQDSAVISPASGVLDVSYNKTSHEFRYRVTWSLLTSDTITGAHIHGTASKGSNAGVVFDFTSAIPQIRSGVFSGAIPADGIILKEDSLLAGMYYFNLHTARYPEGEIRGQIEFQ